MPVEWGSDGPKTAELLAIFLVNFFKADQGVKTFFLDLVDMASNWFLLEDGPVPRNLEIARFLSEKFMGDLLTIFTHTHIGHIRGAA